MSRNENTSHAPILPSPFAVDGAPRASSRVAGRALRGRPRHRRGVLLLVVLSILVLFVVIAVTFVLIAGQARRSLRAEAVVERYTNDPQRQCDEAVYQVFRGSDNAQSSISTLGILEDMYGANWIECYLAVGQPPTLVAADGSSGQLVDLYVSAVDPATATNPVAGASQLITNPATNPIGPFSQIAGYYNGQVLTMTSGIARGLSTRIVGYMSGTPGGAMPDTTGNTATFRVMAFDGIRTYNVNTPADPTTFIGWYTSNPNADQRVLINGRAFNGTGVGLNTITNGPNAPVPGQTQLNAVDPVSGMPYALLLNPKYFKANPLYQNNTLPALNYSTPVGPGGANEDYDAPDPQNPHLAWIPYNYNGNSAVILPSFHRPDLIQWYINNNNNTNWNGNVALQRQVILRPLQADHPNFTGSNPGFNPVGGPYDVDNDQDGTPESVWLDIGFPVQTAPNGQTYKPLAAFLILDLDGRINLNAAGNLAQAYQADNAGNMLYDMQEQGPLAMSQSSPTVGLNSANPLQNSIAGGVNLGAGNPPQLPRGLGTGPAEINPGVGLTTATGTPANAANAIFQGNGALNITPLQSYQQLLTGFNPSAVPALVGQLNNLPAVEFDGRYGELPKLIAGTTPLPGKTNGITANADDVLGAIKHFDMPQNWFSPTTAPTTVPPTTWYGVNNGNNLYLSSYGGAPPDLLGRSAIGLDYRGQPIFFTPTMVQYGDTLAGTLVNNTPDVPNDPYTINLSPKSVRPSGTDPAAIGFTDNPFTPGELERILRPYDVDNYSLPDRLRFILEGGPVALSRRNLGLRQLITTDSYDVPSPNVVASTDVRAAIQGNQTQANAGTFTYPNSPVNLNVADLLAARLAASGNNNFNTAQNPTTALTAINVQLTKMLPPEVVSGQYFDLNRPFGNGRDDNANNVVDEMTEFAVNNETGWPATFPNALAGAQFNLINGVDFNQDTYFTNNHNLQLTAPYNNPQLYARQLYARYLYVMMLMLIDQTGAAGQPSVLQQNWTLDGNLSNQAAYNVEVNTRRIAQWAINVVDFRDADAAMTPFEYDVNPFNGWDIDGIIETTDPVSPASGQVERRVVWGAEYPELLLTETFALHDRRLRDSANDNGIKKTRYNNATPPAVTDETMDQIRIPQGSLFVELYCPRANSVAYGGTQAVYPADLYTYNPGNGQWMLDLSRLSAGGNGKNPVWRLIISTSIPQYGQIGGANQYANNVQALMVGSPNTVSLDPPCDPSNMSIFNNYNHANNPLPTDYQAPYPVPISSATNTGPSTQLSGLGPFQTERIVWFGNVAGASTTTPPPGVLDNTMIFWNQTATAGSNQVLLQPGGYAVVGPRPTTVFGRQTFASQPAPMSAQLISLNPVSYTSAPNSHVTPYPASGSNIQQPLGIICGSLVPAAWGGNAPAPQSQYGIGISVSEPLASSGNYYAVPTQIDSQSGLQDSYGTEGNLNQPFLDQPYETSRQTAPTVPNPNLLPLNLEYYGPNPQQTVYQTNTYVPIGAATPYYKMLLLQRLANPQLEYNPSPNDPQDGGANQAAQPINPYVTVDWLPINLTVFNGEQIQSPIPAMATPDPYAGPGNVSNFIDPDDPNYQAPINAGTTAMTNGFGTVQRGLDTNSTSTTGLNLWSQKTGQDSVPQLPTILSVADAPQSQTAGGALVFPYDLDQWGQTLGFLNRGYLGNGGSSSSYPWSSGPYNGHTNSPAAPSNYVGDPNPNFWSIGGLRNNNALTFPWITWMNRPFVSHYDLLQVPAASAGRLPWEYSFQPPPGSPQGVYGDGTQANLPTYSQEPFGHLLNFGLTSTQAQAGAAPHFYRLFEYVRVPSRFVGTETMLNPNFVSATVAPTTSLDYAKEQSMFSYLYPPFNKVSRYRDPGKVNINTIPHLSLATGGGLSAAQLDQSAVVWNAVTDSPLNINAGAPTPNAPTWTRVATSIQNGTSGAGTWTMGSTPSMFSYPFRSYAGADYCLPNLATNPRGIDATFMRPDPVNTSNAVTNAPMLFDFPSPQYVQNAGTSAFYGYNAPDRNSYFRYQNLAAMGNVLTTRSNVYAVWVTIGYFQVQPVASGPSQIYPDGYTLCDELGSDTGNVTRHRAFYIFDRTIPVAFERGINHNVDRAILLRRYIE